MQYFFKNPFCGFSCIYERVQPVKTRIVPFVAKKNSTHKFQILTTPKLGAKITVLVLVFITALTLDVKIVLLGCQNAVCVLKMQCFGVVNFNSSTLGVYCLSSRFVYQIFLTYSTLWVLCGFRHLS